MGLLGGILKSAGFLLGIGKPLDYKYIATSVDDMLTMPVEYKYEGMQVYVNWNTLDVRTGIVYKREPNVDGTLFDHWKPLGGSGDTIYNGNRRVSRNISGLYGVTPGGTNLKEFLDAVFFPSEQASASISASPAKVEKGTSVLPDISASISPKDSIITSRTISVNGVAIHSFGGNSTAFTDSTIRRDTITYRLSVVTSNHGTIIRDATVNFFFPYYYGAVNSKTVTGTQVKGLVNKIIDGKSNHTGLSITGNGQYMCIAYPKAYGLLGNILQESDSLLPLFTQAGSPLTVMVPFSGFPDQEYYVYVGDTLFTGTTNPALKILH